MTKRGITSFIFAAIVLIEILYFINQDAPKKFTDSGNGGFFNSVVSTDREEQKEQNTKFAMVLIATIAVGAIVTFSIPSDKLSKNEIDTSNFKTKD